MYVCITHLCMNWRHSLNFQAENSFMSIHPLDWGNLDWQFLHRKNQSSSLFILNPWVFQPGRILKHCSFFNYIVLKTTGSPEMKFFFFLSFMYLILKSGYPKRRKERNLHLFLVQLKCVTLHFYYWYLIINLKWVGLCPFWYSTNL